MYYKLISDDTYFDTFSKTFIKKNKISNVLKKINFSIFNELLNRRNINRLFLVFTITTKCNLHCNYCFQNGCKRSDMFLNTQENVFKKIKDYVLLNNINYIDVTIFGGEPFLNVSGVKKIFCFFEKLHREYFVETNYLITTNGLNSDFSCIIDDLKNNNVNVQITFDGTELINNKRRISIDNSLNVYLTILKNLKIFLKTFNRVFIKYNFDKSNIEYFNEFLSDIEKNCGEYKNNITIILESIQNTVCNKYSDYLDNTSLFLADTYIDLVSILIDSKFSYITKIFSTPCMHTSNHSFMIDTNGEFYSCLSAYGIEDFKIDLKNGNYFENYNKRKIFRKVEILEKNCQNCEYLPCCYGGCAYELYSNGKNIFKDINCRKKYFDHILNKFYNDIYLKRGVNKIE